MLLEKQVNSAAKNAFFHFHLAQKILFSVKWSQLKAASQWCKHMSSLVNFFKIYHPTGYSKLAAEPCLIEWKLGALHRLWMAAMGWYTYLDVSVSKKWCTKNTYCPHPNYLPRVHFFSAKRMQYTEIQYMLIILNCLLLNLCLFWAEILYRAMHSQSFVPKKMLYISSFFPIWT